MQVGYFSARIKFTKITALTSELAFGIWLFIDLGFARDRDGRLEALAVHLFIQSFDHMKTIRTKIFLPSKCVSYSIKPKIGTKSKINQDSKALPRAIAKHLAQSREPGLPLASVIFNGIKK